MKYTNCSICKIDYEINEMGDIHDESLTHQFNYYNTLKELYQADELDKEDIFVYRNKKKLFDNINFNCGFSYIGDCNYNSSMADVIQHEKTCFKEFNIANPRANTILIDTNAAAANQGYKFLSCDYCDKKFYEKGQKLKPLYALNNHKKKCIDLQTRKKVSYIIEHLKTFRNIRTDEEREYINNIYDESLLWS